MAESKRKKQPYASLFIESLTATKDMTDEQFGKLMRAILRHRFYGETYEGNDIVVSMAFTFLSGVVDRAAEVSAERSVAGEKGGKSKAGADGQDLSNASNCKQTQANASSSQVESNQFEANQDNRQTERQTDYSPSVGEVVEYAASIGYGQEVAAKFWQYNEEHYWATESGPIKDWKSAFRGWAAREKTLPAKQTRSGGKSTFDILLKLAQEGKE